MVAQLVAKVHIFCALPLLGLTVSSLLGRHERAEPAAAAQMLQLGRELGRLRAAQQALQTGSSFCKDDEMEEEEEESDDDSVDVKFNVQPAVPESEVLTELYEICDSTNVEAFVATLLAPGVEELSAGLKVFQDQITTLGQEVRAGLPLGSYFAGPITHIAPFSISKCERSEDSVQN